MLSPEIPSLKILLVEDDPSFTALLSYLLRELGVSLLQASTSYESGLQDYRHMQPDICLLDIELQAGQKDGIDLATAIREENKSIPIIFLTSHFSEEHYLRAREVHPSSFMNKELSRLKLLQAVEIAYFQIKNSLSPQPTPTKAHPNQIQEKNKLFFKVGDIYKSFDLSEILYFHADNKLNYARIGTRNFPTSLQLKVLEEELHPTFLRCHKKYLVNIKKIDSILIKDDKVKIGNDLLAIGYSYKKDFLEGLNLIK